MFYAKNRNVNFAIKYLERQIQLAIDWFIKWRLKLNATKSLAVLFSKKKNTSLIKTIKIDGVPIHWANTVKYLGVIIGLKLTFKAHISAVIKKATKVQNILYPVLNKNSAIPL
jgi:hypothetical protein